MKHSALLFSLLLITTCGGSGSARPTCDKEGVSLKHKRKTVTGTAINKGSEYYISISVGGQAMEAIADTGSSNLIVASNIGFRTSDAGSNPFTICYGADCTDTTNPDLTTVNLTSHSDTVDLNCDPTGVPNFNYGYITSFKSNNNSPEESLLGLAYKAIAEGPAAQESTFFEQLFLIKNKPNGAFSDEFSMLLCGGDNPNSLITFGSSGRPTATSTFDYVPIVQKNYYTINATTIQTKDGSQQFGTLPANSAGCHAGTPCTIVDSGTTLNLFPSSIYNAIVSYVQSKGITVPPSKNPEMPCPNAAQLATLQNITVALDNNFTLSMAPSTYFKRIPGSGGQCFFGFGVAGNLSILGQVAMENYLVHFDRKNNRIGFGPNTQCGS